MLILCYLLAAAPPPALIGYTEFRTDLPGGRHANVVTMRAAVVRADGTGRRTLADELAREAGYSTQFAGWTPDGKSARVRRNGKSAEVAKWEEDNKTFRPAGDGVRSDEFLVDPAGKAKAVPVADKKSAFVKSLVYGLIVSPDGKRSAYTSDYKLHLADGDGSRGRRIDTGKPFNFVPTWSPDGSRLLFLCGEHYDCHPHLLNPDGTGLTKLADRNGYRGVTEFLDVPDFHGGSSDVPVWSPDGKTVFYTSKVGKNVELFRIPIDGKPERLTRGPDGATHYHPQPSPDGKWVVYGSRRDGVRNLYVMNLSDGKEFRLTDAKKGHAAMWPHWQPAGSR